MKNRLVLASVLSALAFTRVAYASGPSGSGTLGCTATVEGSILLTFITDASGLAVTGTATSTASLPFGTIRMYGGAALATNVTRTLHTTVSFDVSTPFDVRVDLANSASATFVLTATLSSADVVNTWTIGAVDISDAAGHDLTALGAYATAVPYTLKVNIPASAVETTISNSIGFTAVGN